MKISEKRRGRGRKNKIDRHTIDLRVYRRCNLGDARSRTTMFDFDRRQSAHHIHYLFFFFNVYIICLIIK